MFLDIELKYKEVQIIDDEVYKSGKIIVISLYFHYKTQNTHLNYRLLICAFVIIVTQSNTIVGMHFRALN